MHVSQNTRSKFQIKGTVFDEDKKHTTPARGPISCPPCTRGALLKMSSSSSPPSICLFELGPNRFQNVTKLLGLTEQDVFMRHRSYRVLLRAQYTVLLGRISSWAQRSPLQDCMSPSSTMNYGHKDEEGKKTFS